MIAVQLNQLKKTYNRGRTLAVDSASFSVEKGELFGLIGPDGAGKTSIFRMLTTLLLPDSGTASVDGFDILKDFGKIRSRIGYMPGKFSLYQDLTIEENLRFFATLFGTTVEENYVLIKDIYEQIEPFKTRRAGKLSGGMKQKLALCCALVHRPSVLFLDEPTTGVDVVSRKEFWDMLQRLKQQGIAILVSTPYMDEATLCDRIALIQTGTILAVNTPQHIVESYGEPLYAIKSIHMYKLLNDLHQDENVTRCFAFGEYLHVSFKNDSEETLKQVMGHMQTKGHNELEIKQIEPTIEDCFIKL